MYRPCLIAVLLVIIMYGCTAPAPEQKAQDPNVTPEGVRITPDVVYGHKFGMALTFDLYQPENQNGAGIIFINSGGWRSNIPDFYKRTSEGLHQEYVACPDTGCKFGGVGKALFKVTIEDASTTF